MESLEPLVIQFSVACSADHAFAVWTDRTTLWWPHGHSVSGDPGLTVTFEPRAGGRIFERTTQGAEHDWGEVLVYEPPAKLVYLWHIGRDRSAATEVEISFWEEGPDTTISIVHRGWERLGDAGKELKDRNRHGWSGLLPHYQRACEEQSV
jgi:uncharacterized protein YndB with AHSA1/START domain